jgi:sterol 3beta-glucosyltransferase
MLICPRNPYDEPFSSIEILRLTSSQNIVAKSGYLAKRGRQNPKYSRYWFTLKGDVLSYYLKPSDLYFPSGNIDLRYSIQASLSDSKDKGKDTKDFSVTTHQRTYWFRADSSTSAKEWVKTLQKVIFRSHNDGDSVKISLPIANVIDIEDSPVLDFAETFKVRVVDNDETYAMDEAGFLIRSLDYG